jgi:hypothetical protein
MGENAAESCGRNRLPAMRREKGTRMTLMGEWQKYSRKIGGLRRFALFALKNSRL